MGSVRAKANGKLFFDFRYLGLRCREFTALPDSPTNRKRLEVVMEKIEAEILLDQFDYSQYFPNSKQLDQIRLLLNRQALRLPKSGIPTLAQFAATWANEKEVDWRDSYKRNEPNLSDNRRVVTALLSIIVTYFVTSGSCAY